MPRSELGIRVLTGVVLVAVTIGAVWLGGIPFTALAALAALLIFAEWAVMFRIGRTARFGGLVVVAGGVMLTWIGQPLDAVIAVGGGAGLLGLFARRLDRRTAFWVASGVLYAGLPGIALVWLRGRPDGFESVLWLLVIVWAADIAAYFAGRALGGAKLAPSISPNKTWAGAIGGGLGAAVVGGLVASVMLDPGGEPFRNSLVFELGAIATVLAVLAILGDLLESALKRRAGVKDSGTLLPGHGGVMDRLDGLVPVACAGALVVAATGWQW